jgi:DNA-binding winged helix-turn-helix (wHTH) protein/TolB-like protein
MGHGDTTAAAPGLRQKFLLENLTVDPVDGAVLGPAGREQLDPKVMDVLCVLAQQAGAVVAREELLSKVWPGIIVTDDALSRCIYQLRRQLSRAGSGGESKTLLETLPKRGYRLNSMPIVPGSGSTAMAPERLASVRRPVSRWRATALIVLAGVLLLALVFRPEERVSIVVLPFSRDSIEEYGTDSFADVMHDEFLSHLEMVGAFDVRIAGREWMNQRGREMSYPEIGNEIGVTTILVGEVHETEGAVLLNLHLIDAETSKRLWNDSFAAAPTADEPSALYGEMTIAIADALDVSISANELARISEIPTSSKEAWVFYLAGKESFMRDTNREKSLTDAIRLFKLATEEDPKFALAWANLAIAHTGMYYLNFDRSATRAAEADAAVKRALDLDPDLPEAHLARANYLSRITRDYDAALEEFAIAEQGMRDGDLYLHRSSLYRRRGDWDAAVADLARALRRDSTNVVFLRQQHINYLFLRQYELAEEYLERIILLFPDSMAEAYMDKAALALYRDGNADLANEYAENPPVQGYERVAQHLHLRWLAAIFARDYQAAIDVLGSASEDAILSGDPLAPYLPNALFRARTYRLAGNQEEAMAEFERARDEIEVRLDETPNELSHIATPYLHLALAETLAGLGDNAGAWAHARYFAEAQDPLRLSEVRLQLIIGVWLPSGQMEQAIEDLEVYLDSPGIWSIAALRLDPRLAPLWADERSAPLEEK